MLISVEGAALAVNLGKAKDEPSPSPSLSLLSVFSLIVSGTNETGKP